MAFNPADYDDIPDDQLASMAKPAFDPSAYSKISDNDLEKMQLQGKHDELKNNALSSEATNPVAAIVGYGANAANQLPYVHDVASAINATTHNTPGGTWKERFDNSEQNQQAMREAGKQLYPGATRLGEGSTILATGAAAPVGELNGLDKVARAAKLAKVSAGYGAAAGSDDADAFATDQDAMKQRAIGTGVGAATGAIAGPVIDAAAPAIARNAAQLLTDETTTAGQRALLNGRNMARPTGDQLRELGSRTFDRAKQIGATYTPDAAQQAVQMVHNEMLESGKLTKNLHGDSLGALQDMAQEAQGGLDLQDLHQWRQTFGDVVNKNLHPNGSMTPDAQRAFAAQTAIDEFLRGPGQDPANLVNGSPEAVKALQDGMGLWKTAARMDDIQRVIDRAQLRENPATSMRAGFAQLASNGKRLRGFDDADQALIRQAAQTSIPMEFMRTGGSRLLNIAGFASHDPLWAAGTQIGTAASRSMAGAMQAQRGQQILNSLGEKVNLPDLNTIPPKGQLSPPPIYGQPPAGPATPGAPSPQVLLPRGNEDTFYQPSGRTLTYQPRHDWEVSPEGFATRPSDLVPPKTSAADRAPIARAGQEMGDRNVKRLMITHQPRADFVGTDNGMVQPPTNREGALLGEDQDMPIDAGEVQAIRGNPKWPAEKRGGPINRKKGGAVFARPKSYPALEKRA